MNLTSLYIFMECININPYILQMKIKKAYFRFYEELNDFLPNDKKKVTFPYNFTGNPAIKDAIEAIGIPHPEIDLILINSKSIDFDYQLTDGDYVSVYPVFEGIDISPIIKLRAKPLRHSKFILDVQLGKLARWLRLLGFDSLYKNDFSDAQIVDISMLEKRIILTRDQDLLKRKPVNHGYWIRATNPDDQIVEIIHRFDLNNQFQFFTRCMICNGKIKNVEKENITDALPEKTKLYYDEFYQCSGCEKIYWKGSHYKKMQKKIEKWSELWI